MKRFSKFLFGIVLFGTSILGVNAQINENVTDYVEDKFFVGSTRFDGNQIIYANDVIAATQNQIKLNLALGMNPFDALMQEIPVYTYSSLFGEWYIQEEDGFKPITDEEEIKKIEENLDIFFVNNVEKELTFEYDGDVNVHHPNVTYEGGVFTLPATLFSFDFEENGVIHSVYTKAENGYTSDLDYGSFAIIEASDIVAMVGSVPYENLQDAVNASSKDNHAVLLDDLTLTETLLLDGENTDNVLNLNEKTLKGVNGEKVLRVDGKDNTLTILNGTIDFNGSTYIEVGNKTQDGFSNKLIVNSDVTMNAGTYGIVLRGDNSELEFDGTLNMSENDALGIMGNGLSEQAGTTITIGKNANVTANGKGSFAFYLPQAGSVTINGGTFEADTVIGIKAGTLTINGGEFTSTGDKTAPVPSNGGINPTGDVIYIEQNSAYADNIKINVADDAVFTSTNGYLIQEYNVDNDKKALVEGKYATINNLENGRYFTETKAAELELNGVKYGESALNEALNASSEEKPVKLLSDVTLSETLLLDGENTNSVLDLNDKTLKGINGEKLLRVDGKDNTLTILNGTIDFNGSTYIEVGNKTQDEYSNKLIVNSDVTMNAGTYGIVLRGDNSELEFDGTLNVLDDEALGIMGNGLSEQAGTTITIGENAKVTANGKGSFAFYLPQAGSVTINGGTFEADTVIGIKAGTLTINGGTFTSTGDKTAPVPSNGGINPTGDVIYIEQNSAYADNIKINVADDAVFTSTNGYLVQEYNVDNDKKALVEGKYATINYLENGRYFTETKAAELEFNGIKYGESGLSEALNASSEEKPVKLLSDVTLSETLLLDGENTNSVLDLNKNTLKGVNGEKVLRVDGKNNTLTISNGTIDFNGSTYIEVGNKTQDGFSNKLIVNSDVTMNAGTYGIVLRGDNSELEFDGTLNVLADEALGIMGNGLSEQAGTTITIGENANVTANGKGSFAFYLPQAGSVTINGGTFEADTVIGIKAGTLTINGGTFTATGEKQAPVASNGGINPTGDVIYIEQNSSYADNIKINVADDAVFTSTNGYLVQEYNVDNSKEALVTGKYTVSHELENGRYYDDTVVYTTKEQLNSVFNSSEVLGNKVFDVTLGNGEYNFLRISNRNKEHVINKVYIKGSGEESTYLNGFMIDAANDAANEYGKTNIKVLKISDLTFTDEVSIGIENVGQSEVNKVDYVIFENVTFDHNGRSGVFFQGLADLESVKNIVFKDCTFKNVKYGILAKHMNGANITVEDCVFEDLGHNGIQLDNNLSGTIVIDNNDFINIADRPIRFGNLLADSKVTISNNEFVNAQDSDGQVIKATSVETGAEVTLQANNWGTLETTIKGMFVGTTLTYFDAE